MTTVALGSLDLLFNTAVGIYYICPTCQRHNLTDVPAFVQWAVAHR